MKSASPAVIAYIDAIRAQSDAIMYFADCYTLMLANGTNLYYTSLDIPVTLDGNTFVANSILIDGMKYTCKIGTDVDQQKITLSAKPTDLVGGVPWLVAIQNGILDGAFMLRQRAFLNSFSPADAAAPIGSIILFKGRIGKVDEVGRSTAKITVNSDLVLLDLQMPRNLYAPACIWVLYSAGCTLNKADFTTAGAVTVAGVAGIDWAPPSGFVAGNLIQGTIAFTSGVNAGISATIKNAFGPGIQFAYPLLEAPAVGDMFTVSQGCDHTMATCENQFNNLVNFRGYPFVPPPTYAL
jgi:uncharacterized phage protein (TIGR02218 family)